MHQRLPRDVADAVLTAGRRAVEEQEPQHIEYTLEVRGEVRDYEGRVVASAPDEFVLIVRDFTDRTRQERVLERERDFSRAVVRSTPSFLALVDEDGILLGVNHALERAAGIPEESWIGSPFWTLFIAEQDVDRAREDFTRLRDGDPPGVVEYEHVAPSGERLVVDWTATIVHDAEGRVRYLLCGLDVTARKQVEEEIRRSRARIVSAGDAERKRLERNLHDGAQQNLVSVSHAVHLAVRELRTDPDKAEEHLDRALTELTRAHEELRELARGLHPQILTLQGLGAAVRALAGRAPISVTVVTVDDAERWTPLVESAAYFVVVGGADQRAQVRESDVGDDPRGAARRRPRRRGRRRRLRRREAERRVGPRRPPRPGGGARRHVRARQPARRRDAHPGRASARRRPLTPAPHGQRLPLDRRPPTWKDRPRRTP